mgnify:FL=1|tara:strand:- start:406 stop:753 length:348 start_codon:yes stop_codon:yes gene_type:complete
MKLYTNIGTGEWFGTQVDSRNGGGATDPLEIPTDKAGLIRFLTSHKVRPSDELCMSAVDETPRAREATTEGKTSANPNRYDIVDAANSASLEDLQSAVYKYLDRIDDALSLKKPA